MLLLNFSHPLTTEQISLAENLIDQAVEQVIEIPIHFDNGKPYESQLWELMAKLALSSKELQTTPILVNLPSFNFITALVLAYLHGRMGYFPPIIRLRPVPESLWHRFEVAEVLNLQTIRDRARKTRYGETS